MKTTIRNADRFMAEFEKTKYFKHFSYNGLEALFDYFEEIERDTGEEMECDVVAICSDFAEYETIEEALSNYKDISSSAELRDKTTVIEFDGGIIVANY